MIEHVIKNHEDGTNEFTLVVDAEEPREVRRLVEHGVLSLQARAEVVSNNIKEGRIASPEEKFWQLWDGLSVVTQQRVAKHLRERIG